MRESACCQYTRVPRVPREGGGGGGGGGGGRGGGGGGGRGGGGGGGGGGGVGQDHVHCHNVKLFLHLSQWEKAGLRFECILT